MRASELSKETWSSGMRELASINLWCSAAQWSRLASSFWVFSRTSGSMSNIAIWFRISWALACSSWAYSPRSRIWVLELMAALAEAICCFASREVFIRPTIRVWSSLKRDSVSRMAISRPSTLFLIAWAAEVSLSISPFWELYFWWWEWICAS